MPFYTSIFLVLLSYGGLHNGAPSLWHRAGGDSPLLPETSVRLQVDGGVIHDHCCYEQHRLGASPVHQRHG